MRFLPAALLFIGLPIANTRSFTYLCIAIAFICSAGIYKQNKSLPSKGIFYSFITFLTIALASVAWSNAPSVSLSQVKHELIIGLTAFFSLYWLNSAADNRKFFTGSLLISFILTLAIAIFSNNGLNQNTWQFKLTDIHGVGFYSTYIAYLFPLMIIPIFLKPFRFSRPLAIITIVLMLPICIGNDNRMAFITIGSTFIFAAILLTSKYWHSISHSLKSLIIFTAFILGIISIYNGIFSGLPQKNMSASEVATFYSSKEARILIWDYWTDRIKENPTLGIGYGWKTPDDHANSKQKPHNYCQLTQGHAHNIFIDQAVRTGIVGLTAFLFTFIFVIKRFWKYYRTNDKTIKIIGITGLSFMFTVIIKNQTDLFLAGHMYLYYFAIIGFLLGHGDYLLKRLKLESS